MTPRLAVLVVHGMGSQTADFHRRFAAGIEKRVWERTGRRDALAVEGVHWAPVLEAAESDLWARTTVREHLDWRSLRLFAVHFLADVLAYQVTPHDRQAYDRIHAIVAAGLHRLAERAGPTAPLAVVAHSLGTIIACNHLYDLQQLPGRDIRPAAARAVTTDTPLERGETLGRLYTLGSPLALANVRYPSYGRPIRVPAAGLGHHHPLLSGGWWNLVDPDDVLAWPLRGLSPLYEEAVAADVRVDVGCRLTGWTPLAHLGYWDDALVHRIVGDGLADDLRTLSGPF